MRKPIRMLALLLAIPMLIALVAGCTPAGQTTSSTTTTQSTTQSTQSSSQSDTPKSPETIKMAYIGPMTGNSMLYGTEKRNVIMMLIEEINNEGGIKSMGGAKLECEYFDDKNDAKETVIMANKIIADPNVVLCLGPFTTGNGLAVKELFNEAKLPLITTSISNPSFAEGVDYCFAGSTTQAGQMEFYGKFIYEDLGFTKGAMLYLNSEWGLSVYENFKKNYEALGGELVFAETYESGSKDFNSQLAKLKAADFEFIYVAGYIAECGPMVNQMRALKIDQTILSSNSLQMKEYVDVVGENGEGQIMLSYFSPAKDNPAAFEAFRDKYLAAYPDNSFDAHVFSMGDMMYLLREIFEEIGTSATTVAELREAVAQAFPTKTNVQGMCSTYGYNADGQVKKPMIPVVIKDGEFVMWTK